MSSRPPYYIEDTGSLITLPPPQEQDVRDRDDGLGGLFPDDRHGLDDTPSQDPLDTQANRADRYLGTLPPIDRDNGTVYDVRPIRPAVASPDHDTVRRIPDEYRKLDAVAATSTPKGPGFMDRVANSALRAAKETVEIGKKSFKAAGYLTSLLDNATARIGVTYARVRYSKPVDFLVGNSIEKATEHGVASPIGFAAIGRIATSVASGIMHAKGWHMPDLWDSHNGAAGANQHVSADYNIAVPHTTSTADNPDLGTPAAPQHAHVAEHFTARSGDTSWGVAEDALHDAAKAEGVNPSNLTDAKHINEAIDFLTRDRRNEGDFYGDDLLRKRLLNEGFTYSTHDLDRAAEAMAREVKHGGDGHLSHAQLHDALQDHKSAAPHASQAHHAQPTNQSAGEQVQAANQPSERIGNTATYTAATALATGGLAAAVAKVANRKDIAKRVRSSNVVGRVTDAVYRAFVPAKPIPVFHPGMPRELQDLLAQQAAKQDNTPTDNKK